MNYDEWQSDETQYEAQLEREAERERDAHYDDVYNVLAARGAALLERAMSPGGVD